jgi:hypothetical protein
MIGFETAQGLFEHLHGDFLVAAVGADLRHEHRFVSSSAESVTKPFFTLAVVILPGIIEEIDAGVEGLLHDAGGFLQILGRCEMEATDPKDGDLQTAST